MYPSSVSTIVSHPKNSPSFLSFPYFFNFISQGDDVTKYSRARISRAPILRRQFARERYEISPGLRDVRKLPRGRSNIAKSFLINSL